ncbi:MAG: hypothetical protein M5R42_11180 [Rhodocyclaceae bacterium]|nr:hypothetical protein [Rhodocyclaceae bacterium]
MMPARDRGGRAVLRQFLDLRLVDQLHDGDGVHELHVHRAGGILTHHHVAGQQQADGGLGADGAVGQLRVAGTENAVGRHVDIDLLFHRRRHVDFGEHAEALLGKRLGHLRQRIVEAVVHRLAESVFVHAFLLR